MSTYLDTLKALLPERFRADRPVVRLLVVYG
jgi:hypothetical protein